jgi:cobalt-zinc-cadmium efflux system outer membrane protein
MRCAVPTPGDKIRPNVRRGAGWFTFLAAFLFMGCHSVPPAPDSSTVASNLVQRVGYTLPCKGDPGDVVFPPGASLDDGLTEDEAVAIALWNNAAFQELLADLGIARGDLIQAGLLPNPEFVYFWPVHERSFKYLFDFPIEALWLRPVRVRSARQEAERVSERLTQAGLDLMRDVRQAYADVVLAREQIRVAGEGVKLRGQLAAFAEKRLKAGDISAQEAATARIDALQAEQDAARIEFELPVQEERLRNLMGLGPLRTPLPLDPEPAPPCRSFDADGLMREAMETRPDAIASAEAVRAAEARLAFAKLGWVRLLGIGDATSGPRNHTLGPGVRFTVPLFNRNQGGIAKAEAELEKAIRNQKTVANQIVLDVQRSHLQYQQTCSELGVLRAKVRPEVEIALGRAQAAYQQGNAPIFIVLETTRQLLDNRLREAQLTGELRRSWAEMERSVGRRLAEKAERTNAEPGPVERIVPVPASSVPRLGPPIPPASEETRTSALPEERRPR